MKQVYILRIDTLVRDDNPFITEDDIAKVIKNLCYEHTNHPDLANITVEVMEISG